MLRRAALVLPLLAGTLMPSGGAAAAVRDCHAWAHYPNVLVSSARNMSCGAAKFDMRRYRSSIRFRFRTPGGFACTRVSGGTLGGQWRCVNGGRAYRFDFGD